MKRFLLLFMVVLLLTSCGKATIDTSSDEQMKDSIRLVKASLPQEQQDEFEAAIVVVGLSGLGLPELMPDSPSTTTGAEQKVKEALHGKTGEEIITLAASIKAKRDLQRKAKAEETIKQADALRLAGEYPQALNRYKEAQFYDPENPVIAQRIVSITADLTAERLQQKAEQTSKAMHLLALGNEFSELGDYAQALSAYEEGLIFDSENVELRAAIASLKAKRQSDIRRQIDTIFKQADAHIAVGDYKLAQQSYQEARRLDSTNSALKKRMVRLNELIQTDLKTKARAMELINNGMEFEIAEDLPMALVMYKDALDLDENSMAARDGIRKIEELLAHAAAKKAYMEKVVLYDVTASLIDTRLKEDVPAVRFKIKNDGKRILSKVVVTIYLKDKDDKIIAEESFTPVSTSPYSYPNNKPLKAGYIWEMESETWSVMDNVPSEWKIGNVTAQVTDVEFAQ